MKKFFIGLFVVILLLIIAAFVLLFTPTGNNILKPYIQAQIYKYSPIPLSLDVFRLSLGSFELELNSQKNIKITSNGTFSLLSQSVDGGLNIHITNPSKLAQIADSGLKLEDNFVIENAIVGKFNNLTINTMSNVAGGKVRIDTSVVNFKPADIAAKLDNLTLEGLLVIAGQKPYASGKLNAVANITGNEKLEFNGRVNAKITQGAVSAKLVKNDFGVAIPSTSFSADLVADFGGTDFIHKLHFISNVGNITSSGKTAIQSLKTNSTYEIDIGDLSPFTPFAGIPLRGSFRTNGKIVGGQKWLNVEGKSDFASGFTEYSVSLEQFSKPKDALFSIKNLKLEEVLYTLSKPSYALGILNANAELKNISKGISGTYSHTLDGLVQADVVREEFDMKLFENIEYFHKAQATFTNGSGVINADVKSSVGIFETKDATLTMEGLSLKAPYTLNLPDLKKLKFLTSKELKGAITAHGEAKYSPKALYADFKSNLLGGTLDAVMDKNLINLTMKNMSSMELLDMLQYPQFFKSNFNGTVHYDTLTESGKMEMLLNKGSFADNQLTNLLKNLARLDITRDVYENVRIDGDIKKKVVTANLDATSSNSKITSKGAQIDLEKDTINANLLLKVQKYELGALVSGKATSPSVSLDTRKLGQDAVKNLLENEKVKEQVEKIEDIINDKAKDLGETIKKGLGNLFK